MSNIDTQVKEEDNERAQLESWIANKIGTLIQKTYPRLQWGVMCNTQDQTVIIVCPSLSTTKGYYIHMHRYTIHALEQKAVMAAGEILERHGVARAPAINMQYVAALPRDLKDNVIASDSAPEPINKCH